MQSPARVLFEALRDLAALALFLAPVLLWAAR